jgi:hypothetical protein
LEPLPAIATALLVGDLEIDIDVTAAAELMGEDFGVLFLFCPC